MINSYNLSAQTVVTDGVLSFAVDNPRSGCAIKHVAGSSTFTISHPGNYLIIFGGSAIASEAGMLTVELQNNGNAVNGALASTTGATTDTSSLSFSTIIKVSPSCCAIDNTANLTLVNSGVGAEYSNVNVDIIKLI